MSNQDMADSDWWRQAVVYQVYPRSFADHDGDGVGDLPGITSRVGYLKALGIDAVWLSPFYPSALADGGYDVDDYRDVDPLLGTLADFDAMVTALHDAGIKLIVDIVPNHTSNRHRWFREALASAPGSPARQRYHFRDGTGPDGSEPPSDWPSMFGGPAWHRVPDGQWYLHLFAPEQPDLNWDNPEVREDFVTTLRFWSDRGVDGFRIDVAHALTKDMSDPLPSAPDLTEQQQPLVGDHPIWDRDDAQEVFREWRKVLNEYDPPRTAVAEAWCHPSRRARYARPESLGQAFNFDLLQADWDPGIFRTVITRNLEASAESGSSSTWVLSNHDVVRHASRYGLPAGPDGCGVPAELGQDGKGWVNTDGTTPQLDPERGLQRARAASLLLLALPGSTYLYQGEELGLHEVADLPGDVLQDPTFERSGHTQKGRDGARVPIPWTREGSSFGFGSGGAHLPQPRWFAALSVQAEQDDPASTLSLYRAALAVRARLQGGESLVWEDSIPNLLHFTRPGGWHCLTNFGAAPVELPAGEIMVTSGPLHHGLLPQDTTAWVVAAH
ncbi:glycoside hydrolase family 13 protein [Nocardioides sp. BP30]|uniref:glycoside hydrolase family 13 protein n=1 Tax=Nocardioides sp. BP30 TaxID=3036374 RepID=UPI002469066F|nr:glycoside hydrolase family 13 protein [Nocardioides sp. BP30]WGL53104.1 glycoside hydrolase family 13 protein [Nocardioides sp. BP30]